MKIKLLTTACGPNGNHFPGEVLDLPPQQAREWVGRRFADAIDPLPPAPPEGDEQRQQEGNRNRK